jgi:hypothetical protein
MIVNIRGTSGSGKTYLIRAYRDAVGGWVRVGPDALHPTGYRCVGGTLVVGSYEATCGGCDKIKTQDEICARVRGFAAESPNVLFEGLLMSHLFSRYRDLSTELGGIVFAFLDTPLDICLQRVVARRERRKAAKKPFNPANTTGKWHDMRRVEEKFRIAGHRTTWLPWEDPLPGLLAFLP